MVSLVPSAAFGYSVGQTIFFGDLPGTLADEQAFESEVFGARHPISRVRALFYDPENMRLKA